MDEALKLLCRWMELHGEKWGCAESREKLRNNVIEESAELITAIQHLRRNRIEFDAVRTEMADVLICIFALLGVEDPGGPSIWEDFIKIAQVQIEILEGKRPPIHGGD